MGLRFVFGRSGVGKTEYLRDYVIKSSLADPDTNYIVMVPEQSNLQTQTDYVLAHPKGGLLNIDILSFKRLAYHIFSETGGFHNRVLDESGKLMILKNVVEECKDKLCVLKKPMERIDSLNKLKSILSEFSQYHVTEETFNELVSKDSIPGLSLKLKDLMTIYDYYLDYISKDYITDEQVMDVLSEKLEVSFFVKKTVFVFDEYTGFTFLQNEVLRKLIRHAKDVIVSLTMDPSYVNETVVPEYDLFALSVKTKSELTQMAHEEKKAIHEPVFLYGNKNSKHEEFVYLEKNLFDYSSLPFEKKSDRIIICDSMNPEDEVRFLREKIAALVRDEGYSYKDIAVVTGDLNRYGIHFEKMMEDAGIPFFIDDSKALSNNRFLEMIKSLLDIIEEDFSYKSVFRFFKSGLYKLTKEETDILENYCIAGDICHFSSWNKSWDKLLKNMSDEELCVINSLREKFISDIKEFVYVMQKNELSVKERTLALFTFLADINVEGKLLAMSDNFDVKGDYIRAVEYRQVYAAVIHLFDELVEISGDKLISGADFAELLDAGFSVIKIGVLPPGNDYVVLADVERSRISKTKVLFLLGANEGIIPRNNERIGFLNESERLVIKESKVTLAPTSHEEYYTQKYYLYRILTKASEKIFISYSNFGDGDELNPSYLVKCIEDLFPCCEHVHTKDYFNSIDYYNTKSEAYDYLLNSEEYSASKWNDYYDYLAKDENYRFRLRKLQEGLIFKGDKSALSESLADKLFLNNNKHLRTSVSRLESFAACPFAHFLRYGIDINDRIRPEMSAIDYGTVFHTALEDYVRILKQMNIQVASVSDEVSFSLAKDCIINAFNKVYRAYSEPTARDKYHIKRMERLMKRTVWAMKKQFTDSPFSIRDVEYRFEDLCSAELSNNKKVLLNGKIDRIDTYSDGLNEVIRIVDYKTGSTGFSLMKFYYGIQLQLVVYLDIVSEIEKKHNNVILAGAFYYNINDPVIDADKVKEDKIEAAILKELRLHGYQNESVSNTADKSTDEKSLQLMMKYSRSKVKELSEAITSGDVAKRPYLVYDGGIKTACDYCDYRQLCLFDSSLPWCKNRKLKSLKEDEIFTKMNESGDADDELDK